MRVIPTAVERFWKHVRKDGPIPTHCPELGPCWLWNASKREGYGRFRVNGKHVTAHRFSWELFYGPIPEGKSVLHKCDNPECPNPEHLFLGTHRDNMDDMLAKDRQRSSLGTDNTHVKITVNQVHEIRAIYALGGITQRALAKAFGVRKAAVWKIVNQRTWTHIPLATVTG